MSYFWDNTFCVNCNLIVPFIHIQYKTNTKCVKMTPNVLKSKTHEQCVNNQNILLKSVGFGIQSIYVLI